MIILKILYGTTNGAKLNTMKKRLSKVDVDIVSLRDLNIFIDVEETGSNPLENAKIKALEYYRLTKIPTFSCDTGLFIDGLTDDLQPGTYVRRYQNQVFTDVELLEHFRKIAEDLGGEANARFVNAISFVFDEERVFDKNITADEFILVSKAHPKLTNGFPLNSIALHKDTREYYVDPYTGSEINKADLDFENFFNECFKNISKLNCIKDEKNK